MRKTILSCLSLAMLLMPAMAQDHPKAELFGGYQFTHLDPDLNANGWNAAVTGNLNSWLGITGDFSGTYKGGGHLYTYMVGPTFSARTERVTPFVHALFGGGTAGGNGTTGSTAFAVALGGGVDVNAGKHLGVRLIQADWLMFRSGGVTDKSNARISAGLVFRF